MPLKTLVKVGSITNLSDARYCAGMGVDFLGFRVVEGQPNAIASTPYQELRGWITGPQIVAEIYGVKHPDELSSIIEQYRPDYFELGVKELLAVGSALTLPFILQLRPGESIPPAAVPPSYILSSINDDTLTQVIHNYEVLISIRSKDELSFILNKTGISGVSLNGGTEIRPGLKSFDELADILEALDEEQ